MGVPTEHVTFEQPLSMRGTGRRPVDRVPANQRSPDVTLPNLPDDVLRLILASVPGVQQLPLRQTCKTIHRLCFSVPERVFKICDLATTLDTVHTQYGDVLLIQYLYNLYCHGMYNDASLDRIPLYHELREWIARALFNQQPMTFYHVLEIQYRGASHCHILTSF